jgi:hypothetical protein
MLNLFIGVRGMCFPGQHVVSYPNFCAGRAVSELRRMLWLVNHGVISRWYRVCIC